MDGAGLSLLTAAAGVAALHTVLGPDHYLPFIMLARARGWSRARACLVTVTCGAGHVTASVALGLVGVAGGAALAGLERVESARGGLAAWALVAFGVAYAVWGARKAVRKVAGLEPHVHRGKVHVHARGDRPHDHPRGALRRGGAAFWSLFAIFVVGPCEPLIPLLVVPASRGHWGWALVIAMVFGGTTVVTMTALTLLGAAGRQPAQGGWLEQWSHALAGGVIAVSGLAILVFEL